MSPVRSFRSIIVTVSVFILLCVAGLQLRAASDQKPAGMKEHFDRVVTIQQAVIRGDLEDVREPAKWIADNQSNEGLPSPAHALIANMRAVARRAADATTLQAAGTEAGALVATCGNCHAALATRPKLPPVPDPPVKSGTVGHMLEHQHAVDLMYQGIVAPSDELWNKGAAELKAAPLARKDLPRDPALTNEVAASEARTHQLAEKALTTRDANGRAAIYGDVISGCGSCHGLHGRVWGPGVPK
jgi:cytochrome c553